MPAPITLSAERLRRLRELMSDIQSGPGESMPHETIVRMASELEPGAGMTIDFAAKHHLGFPLVVYRPPDPTGDALSHLTSRERQVASLIAKGLANKEIARALGIQMGTVKDHVHRILEKTGLTNRAAIATAHASRPRSHS